MQTLIQIVLSNLVFAAALALAAWIISKFWKNQQACHLLWLMVLAKLVTPPLWSIPLPIPQQANAQLSFFDTPTADPLAETSSQSLLEQGAAIPPEVMHLEKAEVAGPVPEYERLESPTRVTGSVFSAATVEDYYFIAGQVFLAASLLCALVVSLRILRFDRLVRRAPTADNLLLDRVNVLAKRMGLRKSPQVRLVDGIVSPMVWPLSWHRMVLLPQKLVIELTSAQLDTVIAHELAHLVRRDDFVRFLETVVTCWFWWNPVVWWARRELHAAEEDCCDALVVCLLPESRRQYGEALLLTAEAITRGRSLPTLASGFGERRSLKRRIEMILNNDFRRGASLRTKFALLMLALAVLPLAATAVSQDEQSIKQNTTENESPDDKVDQPSTPTSPPDRDAARDDLSPEAWADFVNRVHRTSLTTDDPIDRATKISDCLHCHSVDRPQQDKSADAIHDFERAASVLRGVRERIGELTPLTEDRPSDLSQVLERLDAALAQLDQNRTIEQLQRATKERDEYRSWFHRHLTETRPAPVPEDPELESTKQQLLAAEARIQELQSQLATSSTRATEEGPSIEKTTTGVSDLDLAERYLRTAADLKLARARVERMSNGDGAHSELQLSEAQIELQRAEKLTKLLRTYIEKSVEGAKAVLEVTEVEFNHIDQLARKGFISPTEFKRAKAQVDRAKARLDQLMLILSETENAASP